MALICKKKFGVFDAKMGRHARNGGGNRVWRMACCQARCIETDPVESFRRLRF